MSLDTVTELSDDQLLDAVDEERQKFTQCDDTALHALVTSCLSRGIYPSETVPGNPNNPHTMVEGWGARWHMWDGTLSCPKCDADLRDHKGGPPFKREIGIVQNDRVSHWKCPDCGGEWGRYGRGVQ